MSIVQTPLKEIEAEGEAEYLDNGGCMSVERRDHYFALTAKYAKALEEAVKQECMGEYGDTTLINKVFEEATKNYRRT